ncbi:MAG: dihydropteroate synthase, partial [Halobacteriota archaeon]
MLVATGRCAEQVVREAVGAAADVLVLNVDIAALMTPPLLREAYVEFSRRHRHKHDVILIPGAANPAAFGALGDELSVKIVLGPKQAYDLGLVLASLDQSMLSLDEPADRIIREKRRSDALNLLTQLETSAAYDFKIRDLKIGGNSRMKVLGEIIDAPVADAKRIALQHIRNGADIIDVGIPLGTAKREVHRTFEEVSAVAGEYNVPLSIDSLDPELICAGIESGADLVLSLTAENAAEIGPTVARKDLAVVVLPENG